MSRYLAAALIVGAAWALAVIRFVPAGPGQLLATFAGCFVIVVASAEIDDRLKRRNDPCV